MLLAPLRAQKLGFGRIKGLEFRAWGVEVMCMRTAIGYWQRRGKGSA